MAYAWQPPVAFLSVCLSFVGAFERSFTGRYTIVNKASGRKIVSDENGFYTTSAEAILQSHMWRILPQGDASLISNAASGGRIYAQLGKDLSEGFFVMVAKDVVYQDQRWNLQLQADGSYVLSNSKSKRCMVDGQSGLVAVVQSVFSDNARWWLVNHDASELAILLRELAEERSSRNDVTAELERCRQEMQAQQRVSNHLLEDLSAKSSATQAQRQAADLCASDLNTSMLQLSATSVRLKELEDANHNLTAELQHANEQLGRVSSLQAQQPAHDLQAQINVSATALRSEKRANAELAAELEAARTHINTTSAELRRLKHENNNLTKSLSATRDQLVSLRVQQPAHGDLHAQIDATAAALGNQQRVNGELAAELDAARTNMNSTSAELRKLKHENDNLTGSLSATRDQLNATSAALGFQQHANDDMTAQLRAVTAELNSTSLELFALRRVQERLMADLLASRNQLNASTKAFQALEAERDSLAERFRASRAEAVLGRFKEGSPDARKAAVQSLLKLCEEEFDQSEEEGDGGEEAEEAEEEAEDEEPDTHALEQDEGDGEDKHSKDL